MLSRFATCPRLFEYIFLVVSTFLYGLFYSVFI
uniref:Uncharacterized protein n=1 Tax=Arundo donax TaxID=35708 RepID=A0A0A8XPS7_ARUDO